MSVLGSLRWPILVLASLATAAACGAADESVDPAALELRDLLGVAPRVAVSWDDDQRAAARAVLSAHLEDGDQDHLAEIGAGLDELSLVRGLAIVDNRLLDDGRDALGLVVVDRGGPQVEGRTIDAVVTTALLRGEEVERTGVVIDLDPRAWPCATAPACDLSVLTALATDAAPTATRVRVVPVTRLSVIAALTTGADGTLALLVNPIVTAVGNPAPAVAAGSATAGGGAAPPLATTNIASSTLPVGILPLTTITWTYPPTIAECATAIQRDCQTCFAGGLCEPIWGDRSGMAACTLLEADPRNYSLLCVNLAVSLMDISSCVAGRDASCAFDSDALTQASSLGANANFLDSPACTSALAACLNDLYGTTSDGGGCGCGSCDSCDDNCGNNNSNCNNDTTTPNDGCGGNGCSGCNSNDSSGNDGCGSCGSSDSNDGSGCSGGSCSGGDSNSGCGNSSGGSGSGCGSSGGGGGGNCSVARQPSRGATLAIGMFWAFLPMPVAVLARRRARRRTRQPSSQPVA